MASVTVGVGPISVTQDNAWDSLWNSIYNESTTFRNMPDSAKKAANEYKADLRRAITKKDPVAAKSALNSMASIYDKQAELVGGSGSEQGRNLQQLAKNCRAIGNKLTKENITDFQIQRGIITHNSTGNDSGSSGSTNSNGAILAMYTTDGTATGKIENVSKLITELQANGYTEAETKSILSTYFQGQGTPETQLAQTVSDALTSANSTSNQVASTTEVKKDNQYV